MPQYQKWLAQDATLDTASSLCCLEHLERGGVQAQACLDSSFRKLATPMLPPGTEVHEFSVSPTTLTASREQLRDNLERIR